MWEGHRDVVVCARVMWDDVEAEDLEKWRNCLEDTDPGADAAHAHGELKLLHVEEVLRRDNNTAHKDAGSPKEFSSMLASYGSGSASAIQIGTDLDSASMCCAQLHLWHSVTFAQSHR